MVPDMMGVGACACCCGEVSPRGSYTFSTWKFDWPIQSSRPLFSTGCAGRIAQSKELESKKLFSTMQEVRFDLQSKGEPFSTDGSDCIIIGLMMRRG